MQCVNGCGLVCKPCEGDPAPVYLHLRISRPMTGAELREAYFEALKMELKGA